MDSKKTLACKHPGCDAAFSKPNKLVIHMRQHTGERPYKCDFDGCDKSYTNSSHLKRHSQTHEIVKKSFKCSKCSMTISNQQNLNRHYKRVHSDKNILFTCGECGISFNKEVKYKEHEAMHKGVALYVCKICPKQFTAISTFKKHERSHDTKKEYKCTAPNCSEVFKKWSLLVEHRNSTHPSEYKCKDCGKVFSNKLRLKSHSFVHIDDRSVLLCPYEKCPRFYFFKRNLDHHIRTNHLGEKYHCDICDKKVSTKQKIIEHMKKIHLPKRKKKKKRKKALARNDTGIPKKSMLSKLVGLDLPRDIEKELLNRKTRVQICEENLDEYSHEIIENGLEIKVVDITITNGIEEVDRVDHIVAAEVDKNKVSKEYSDRSREQTLGNSISHSLNK